MLESNTTTPAAPTSTVLSAKTLPASMHLASMTVCVAAESHAPADVEVWRDVFCQDCGKNECIHGTARELAEKVIALGWIVKNVATFDVMCPACVEVFG